MGEPRNTRNTRKILKKTFVCFVSFAVKKEAIMQWKEIRNHYPNQWLLIEAIKARTESDKRILDDIAVINTFSDAAPAMKTYIRLHRESPERELYVLHTDRKEPDITERRWVGIRGNQ
jgi:hypothetical protein